MRTREKESKPNSYVKRKPLGAPGHYSFVLVADDIPSLSGIREPSEVQKELIPRIRLFKIA